MVLRVCQQVLDDPHDAEDAFQATFLVFFRRAGSITQPWFAGKLALRGCPPRGVSSQETGHPPPRPRTTVCGTGWPENPAALRAARKTWPEIHEEVASLPDRLRSPVVLCYLKGLTAEAAALELGCPRGTVLSRLSSARERLRDRLSRRGLGLPAGLLTAGLTSSATEAAVPAALADSLVRSALSIATDKTTAAAASPAVAALTHGVLNMMSHARLIRIAAAAAAIGLADRGNRPRHASARAGGPAGCSVDRGRKIPGGGIEAGAARWEK